MNDDGGTLVLEDAPTLGSAGVSVRWAALVALATFAAGAVLCALWRVLRGTHWRSVAQILLRALFYSALAVVALLLLLLLAPRTQMAIHELPPLPPRSPSPVHRSDSPHRRSSGSPPRASPPRSLAPGPGSAKAAERRAIHLRCWG